MRGGWGKLLSDLWWAAVQLVAIWAVSNAPLFSAILVERISSAPPPPLLDLLNKNLRGGEVFIYSAALVAPFWWTLYQYLREKEKLPLVWVPITLALVSLIAGALIFATFRVDKIIDVKMVNHLGLVIYVASLVVWYWSLFGDRRLPTFKGPYEAEKDDVSKILKGMGEGRQ